MAAHAIRFGDEWVLLDLGPGALRGIAAAGGSVHRIRAVFLSHLHTDHVGDLAPLLFSRRFDPLAPVDPAPIEIWGPSGTAEHLDLLNRAHRGHLYDAAEPPPLVVFGEEEPMHSGTMLGAEVTAVRVEHGSGRAYGYRIETPGFALSYSGDSAPCDALVELATGADVFLCECSAPDDRPIPGHLTPLGVARIAAHAGCRKVVLTHLYPMMDDIDAESIIRRRYDGEVVRGGDGLRISLI